MKVSHVFETVDTHTAGNSTRNIVSGLPEIPGNTMAEKMAYAEEHLDWIRTTTMWEPRGHRNMSGTFLVEPCHPEAHMGVLFIDAAGHMPMCGHSTIGSVTAMLETGMIPMTGDRTEVNIDTPAGLIRTIATTTGDRVHDVTFRNVPSFLYTSGTIELPEFGEISFDLGFGGNTYAIVDANDFGLDLRSGNLEKIISTSQKIGDAVRSSVDFVHPEQPFINTITHVQFYCQPDDPKCNYRNCVIFLPDSVDRSPCGTGTSARVASLFAKGELALNEEFIHESFIGTQFKARIVEPVEVGPCKGGVPEVTGTAHVTGKLKLIVDPNDPLKDGFHVC